MVTDSYASAAPLAISAAVPDTVAPAAILSPACVAAAADQELVSGNL